MLSCIAWIPKGAPAKVPQPYELPPEALAGLTESMKNTSIDGSADAAPAAAAAADAAAATEGGVKMNRKAQKQAKRAAKAAAAAKAEMGDDDEEEEEQPADDDGVGSDLEGAENENEEDLMKALGMDKYDDEDEDEGEATGGVDDADAMADGDGGEGDEGDDDADAFGAGGSINQFLGAAARDSVAPEDDEYLDEDEDDEEEDAADNHIRATDSCILVGNTSEEQSVVEVYVFDEATSNLYVHHEFSIPSMPLALAWLPTHPRAGAPNGLGGVFPATGSFAAVGSFLPGIELWNCDVMNPVEPVAVLGGFLEQDPLALAAADGGNKAKKGKGKKGASKKPTLKPGSHSDAVLCLSVHPSAPARLASGSADCTVKLWDVGTQQCTATFADHKDKVQALEWQPAECNVLLSGGYDQRVCVRDVRLPAKDKAAVLSFPVSADIEVVRWDPHAAGRFLAATEDGVVVCHDVRMATGAAAKHAKPVWALRAHKKATSCLAVNAVVPGLFATASEDGSVKIWAPAQAGGDAAPQCIGQRSLNIGRVLSMAYDASSPFVLAAGGDCGTLAIWDTLENVGVNERYGKQAEQMGLGPQTLPADYVRMQKEGGQSKGVGPGREGTGRNAQRKGLVGAGNDDGDSESDGDDGPRRMTMHSARGGDDDDDDDDDDE